MLETNHKAAGKLQQSAAAAKLLDFKPSFGMPILSHQEVSKLLLKEIKPIDFYQKSGLDQEQKLQKRHYSILVIGWLLETAKANKWGMCAKDESIYLFNGWYWKRVPKAELLVLLGDAAIACGMDYFQASHHEFKDELYKQFVSQATLIDPNVADDKVLINLQNGTLEITPSKRILRPPCREDFLTYQLPFKYDPTAKAPIFQSYLDKVLPDTECQKVLAEYVGYLFVHHLKLEKVLILYGSGCNGKSVFYEVLNALVGRDNVSSYSLQSLTTEGSYERAELQHKLLNYSSEISGKLEADKFKQMASGEPISARKIYGSPFIMTKYAKLIFNTNELPYEVEHTEAFYRRFIIIPFTITIAPEERDVFLADNIIKNELAGVLNWAFDGLDRLLKSSAFTECNAVRKQIEEYRIQTNSVLMFLSENNYSPQEECKDRTSNVYQEYRSYCYQNGYHPIQSRKFNERLKKNGYQITRGSGGMMVGFSKTI